MDDTTRPVKLGPEIGKSINRNVRHQMFAIVDRTQLQAAATSLSTAITIPPTPPATVPAQTSASLTFQLAPGVPPGTTTYANANTGRQVSIQVGSLLTVDVGANQETVTVTGITAGNPAATPPTPPTYTATFTTAHASFAATRGRGAATTRATTAASSPTSVSLTDGGTVSPFHLSAAGLARG